MKADFAAVLDACVLIPMPLADTLFRLAESPRLYLPKWSDSIMEEVSRNLQSKLNLNKSQVQHREEQLRTAFPEAWVEGYEPLIPWMTNDVKDRHVLAAAVRCNAGLIVTYNRRDFPAASLRQWDVEVIGPSSFLRDLYDLEPAIVQHKINEQSNAINLPLDQLLAKLRINVPGFVDFFCSEIGLELPPPLIIG